MFLLALFWLSGCFGTVKVIQISVGGFDKNFSYLVIGEKKHSKEGILIDPTGFLEAIETEIKKHSVKIVMQIFTHAHPDHTELLEHFKSIGIKTFVPKSAELGEKESLLVAGISITAIHTPGHTSEGVCFLIENNLFSGDTLFVRGIGTTAYGGNDAQLKETLDFLCTLNSNLVLWPGHDYGGASSALGTALKNSHIKPDDRILEIIKKKVADYEKKNKNRKKFL